jgi:hypothetical protein
MKNNIACKALEHTWWTRNGDRFELLLSNTFWYLECNNKTITLPLTLNCPKPERIVNWLEQYGYTQEPTNNRRI